MRPDAQSVDVLSDPALPTLAAVLSPGELGEHLRRFLPAKTRGLADTQVRLLRHRAGKRCVVEITLRTTEATHHMIGKVYAEDRSDIHRLMEEVARAGFGPKDALSIPRPVGYLNALQLLLQERVAGQPATDWFLSGEESERRAAAERCGRWLARFHATAPRIGPPQHLSSHLLAIEQWFRRLLSVGEPFADRARRLFERLKAVASQGAWGDPCAVHGDYSHHQVILARGRTVAVDWDGYGVADPGRDLAHFVVGLERLALCRLGSSHALEGAARAFLKAYLAVRRSDVTSRLAFHKAALWLEHAKHDVHKQAHGWRGRAEASLDEGLRVLEQEA